MQGQLAATSLHSVSAAPVVHIRGPLTAGMHRGGPTLDGMQPTDFLARHGGVARLAHLRRAGFTRGQIGRAVDSGLMQNPRHGIYRLPEANCDFVSAYEANAAVTCVSAAGHYALWTLQTPASRTSLPVTTGWRAASCRTGSAATSQPCTRPCSR